MGLHSSAKCLKFCVVDCKGPPGVIEKNRECLIRMNSVVFRRKIWILFHLQSEQANGWIIELTNLENISVQKSKNMLALKDAICGHFTYLWRLSAGFMLLPFCQPIKPTIFMPNPIKNNWISYTIARVELLLLQLGLSLTMMLTLMISVRWEESNNIYSQGANQHLFMV